MKQVRTQDAVGQILCHDITQIVPGVSKGPVFRKGHVITEADVPVLLSVGKEHIYIWENDESMMHEDDAAMVLCELSRGDNMRVSDVAEGKVELIAEVDGVLKIDRPKLRAINSLGEMMIASRHGDTFVRAGDKIAGMRVIPLVIERAKMEAARAAAPGGGIFKIIPTRQLDCAVITTGSEVYSGIIEDAFTPVLEAKLAEFGARMTIHETTNDEAAMTEAAIRRALEAGAELVLVSGGMSVDPDDRTPAAIRAAASEVVTYGAPILPGAMFMLAYSAGGVPIMGLPGCVMYAGRTIFDIVLPRALAGERLTPDDFTCLGEGGLCLACPTCTYPNCGFGKGR